MVVNFPHNPTGYLPSREEFNQVVEIARAHGLYLLGDEMYRFLEHKPGGPPARGVRCLREGNQPVRVV